MDLTLRKKILWAPLTALALEAGLMGAALYFRLPRPALFFLGAGAVIFGAGLVLPLVLSLRLLSALQRFLKEAREAAALEYHAELPGEAGELAQEFNRLIRKLHQERKRLLTETIRDPITGFYNFRFFEDRLKEEAAQALRYNHLFSLLFLEIDRFQEYQEGNGLGAADLLLKQMSSAFKQMVRADDFVAYCNEGRFAIMLPEMDKDKAQGVAARLRETVEKSDSFGRAHQPGGKLTLSIGAALFPTDAKTAAQHMEKANRALYVAKTLGGNRIIWSEETGFS